MKMSMNFLPSIAKPIWRQWFQFLEDGKRSHGAVFEQVLYDVILCQISHKCIRVESRQKNVAQDFPVLGTRKLIKLFLF